MIKDKLNNWIKESLGREDFVLAHPKLLEHGDYSVIVSDKSAKDDFEILKSKKPDFIDKVDFIPPRFINLRLSKAFFKESLKEIIEKEENFGGTEIFKEQKVMVEHTQPNPFKKFHIGHLMNNVIGEAVARTVLANGAEVKTCSYHGDIGLHVAKALWKGDYALGAKAYEEDPRAKSEIEDLNKKIYDKSDSEINAKYQEGRKKSLEEFEKIYQRLGSNFDYHFFESDTAEIGKKIVLDNAGRVFEESEGAVVFKGSYTRVFVSSQGLPTYEAKELGLAKVKREKYNFDQSITVTGNEQDAFFNVVEEAIGKVFPELKGKLSHLSHGMLRLPSGKMSSRTGEVITTEELIEEVKGRVRGDEQVAVGAIKYMILRQTIGNDIIFDFEKSVSTEGDSGVYLQYAHARANSVLQKSGVLTPSVNKMAQQLDILEIERLLYRFPEIVERAGQEYAPNYITTYLTELAASFNNFYAKEPIIGDSYRLAITSAFKIVMRNGLWILGIPAPERL